MMSGIRGKDTKPELVIRKALFARGFRYRLHDKQLPGKPDIVFPKYNAVVFAHGCFWHGHQCHLFKWPSTRPDFWQDKIYRNIEIDKQSNKQLKEKGWRIFVVWECALKGKKKRKLEYITNKLESWLKGTSRSGTITG